ncbi:MAG: Mut7-C RNAse domain-containing protein [Candidatus Methylomirabilales bacterium]
MTSGAAAGAPRFLADAMLGRLATWLRVLGYDAEYHRGGDAALVARARAEDRILLTRDTGLVRRRDLPRHLFVESDAVRTQLAEVLTRLGLPAQPAAEPRCLRCNVRLEPRSRSEVEGRVPDFVWASQQRFWGCPRCRRLYWPGTHRRHMAETIRSLAAVLDRGEG